MEQEQPQREPTGAPPFLFELSFVLIILAIAALLYGPLRMLDRLVDLIG